MNASEYGNIPQNRENIYIVGFLNKKHYDRFDFPEPIELNKKITGFIDINIRVMRNITTQKTIISFMMSLKKKWQI